MSARLDTQRSSVIPAPSMRDLARRLLAQGASPGLAQRVVARVETLGRNERDVHPLDLAARVIGEAFPRVVMRAPRNGPAVVSVLGSRGSGRSTFVRKLALRLRGTGRRVSVLAAAQHGSSRPEWIATWMREIGAFGCVVDAEREIPARALAETDVVLIDGCGDLARDAAIAQRVARRESRERLVEMRMGTLAADASPERLRAEARALRAISVDCSVVTRLDLAEAPAAAFEIASTASLPVAFICDGADEQDHLHRSSPDRAADVFLKGRIA